MKSRKPKDEDLDLVELNLSVLRKQIEDARNYLEENPWNKIIDPDKRSRELDMQRKLSDSMIQWSQSYMSMSGIIEVYNMYNTRNSKTQLKSGQTTSGIQKIIQSEAESKSRKTKR